MHGYLAVLRKYARFKGRTRRREYWQFVLFNVWIAVALFLVDTMVRGMTGVTLALAELAYGAAVLLPSVAVTVRRLHDTSRSGWWLVVGLIPVAGFVLIFLLAQDSAPSRNRYGPNPKYLVP